MANVHRTASRASQRCTDYVVDTSHRLRYTARVLPRDDVRRDFLVELLNAYWFAPPVALWRAIELRAMDALDYDRPLLDLGCGDGLIGAVLFGQQEAADVGIDPWADQLHRAADLGVYGHLDQGLGDALPYGSGHFSTVLSNSVLEHIRDVEPVLHEVARVLRPGGRFIFTVPSDVFRQMLDGYVRRVKAGDLQGAEAYARRIDQRLEHHHYYTPVEWERLLSEAGMTLLKTEYYMPERVERFWDRMNDRYGVNRRTSAWKVLVSPHLQALGYQGLVRRLVVSCLSRRWRSYYEMDVQPGKKGGGLLVLAQRKE